MFLTTERKESPKKHYMAVDTFCRIPEDGRVMVQCSQCGEWYQSQCANVPQTALNNSEVWLCEHCCS